MGIREHIAAELQFSVAHTIVVNGEDREGVIEEKLNALIEGRQPKSEDKEKKDD